MSLLKMVLKNNFKKACNSKFHIVGLCHRKRISDILVKTRSEIRTDTHTEKQIYLYHYGGSKN